MILLDTHAVIWFAKDTGDLGRLSLRMTNSALEKGELAISAISFWEIALLFSKQRLKTIKEPSVLRRELLSAGAIELPLSGDIALLSVELNLHSDPADRFIAATAIAHEAILMTADKNLLKWRHKLKRQNALQ